MSQMSSLRRQLTDYWPSKHKRIRAGRRAKLDRVSKMLATGRKINEAVKETKLGVIARLRQRLLPRRAA